MPHRRDHHVDLLDRLHQALVIVHVTLQIILKKKKNKSSKTQLANRIKRLENDINFINQDEVDAQSLEVLDDFGLCRVGEGSFSDQNVGGVASLGAGLDNELSDVASATDEEDFGLGCHPEWDWGESKWDEFEKEGE